MNRYSSWKYILILFFIGLGLLFALPNIYGKDPSLQVSAARSAEISELTEYQVSAALEEAELPYKNIMLGVGSLTIRFSDEETQLKAQAIVKESLGRSYVVALNLAPATPDWLSKFGAEPMSLGLDLRGGVHFLMEVDMDAAIDKAEERYISDLRSFLRENKVRYKTITRNKSEGLLIRFKNNGEQNNGQSLIEKNFLDLNVITQNVDKNEFSLSLAINEDTLLEIQRLALQQNITTLRKRVNELGVAEPVIQRPVMPLNPRRMFKRQLNADEKPTDEELEWERMAEKAKRMHSKSKEGVSTRKALRTYKQRKGAEEEEEEEEYSY